jgi:non-specific protein-tyrosine kinase
MASTTLLFQPSNSWMEGDTSEQLAKYLALTGRLVMRAGGADLESSDASDRSAGGASIQWIPDTPLIELTAVDTDPVQAAARANDAADAFIAGYRAQEQKRYGDYGATLQEQMDELSTKIEALQAQIAALPAPVTSQNRAEKAQLETTLATYRQIYANRAALYGWAFARAVQARGDIVVIAEAAVPQQPIDSSAWRVARKMILAGIVGVVLAIGVAFLLEYLDDTIKTADDANQTLGLSILGAIGKFTAEDGEVIAATQPRSSVAEAFRMLRTNIRYSEVDHPVRTILVTSAGPGEGKSTTVANLAVVMAQAGRKTVVVDGDLRQPWLHRLFGVPQGGGLAGSLLIGNLDGNVQRVSEVDGLSVLPAGSTPLNPADMLATQRMRALLDELAQQMDVVLIDSPPVLPVTDAAVLAHMVDGVLLVVDAGETRRGMALRAVEALRQAGGNPLGVVLNRVPAYGEAHDRGYYYDYCRDADRESRRRDRRQPKLSGALRLIYLGRGSGPVEESGLKPRLPHLDKI